MIDFLSDLALVTTSCAYAEWLAEHKNAEPDWTWVEVAAGVAYVLAHAAVRGTIHGGDWKAGQAEVLRSMFLGGAPIAVGELAQWLKRREILRTFDKKWQ